MCSQCQPNTQDLSWSKRKRKKKDDDSVRRTNQQAVQAGNRGNLLDVLDTLPRLDLHQDEQVVVRVVVVLGARLDAGEGVGGEHGPIPARALGRVFAVPYDVGGILLSARNHSVRKKWLEGAVAHQRGQELKKKRVRGGGEEGKRTHCCVAHGHQDTMGTGVQGPLDHPLLSPGYPDDGTGVFGTNCIDELLGVGGYNTHIRGSANQKLARLRCRSCWQAATFWTNLVVMVVRDQAVLGVNQDPGEAAGGGEGRGAKHGLGHGRGRESRHGVNVEYTWLLGREEQVGPHSREPEAESRRGALKGFC